MAAKNKLDKAIEDGLTVALNASKDKDWDELAIKTYGLAIKWRAVQNKIDEGEQGGALDDPED